MGISTDSEHDGADSQYKCLALNSFPETLGTLTELSSVALGGEITAVSDEFFAEAFHLLKVEPAPSLKGQFGPKGALFSGWESRRHNPYHDWCLIKLGATGFISGFDIDTSHFNGNEAPEASVQALYAPEGDVPMSDDLRWVELLPKVPLGPNSRHLFKLKNERGPYNFVKLNMYPDGGIARFRAYGIVDPVFTEDASGAVDLAHVLAGGRVVYSSDQHFGVGSNLLLPGRGKDMGDGWETKRSRFPGHKDWVIVRLGESGTLEQAEIDTAHFKGNYPESCELHALLSQEVVPVDREDDWVTVLPRTKLGPHRRHFFQLENVQGRSFSHVRMTIYPDGGVKRLRIIGWRNSREDISPSSVSAEPSLIKGSGLHLDDVDIAAKASHHHDVIPALPLTPEAFAPFGQVVQAWADPDAAPKGVKVTPANQGSANKFHKLSLLQSSYPLASGATTGLSVYRCKPLDVKLGERWDIRALERHPYTNQAFIPMGVGAPLCDDVLETPGRAYLVVVAQNGSEDKPDLQTLRAFVAHTGQAIVYNTGIWHHPMVALETTIDFTCVETQIGNGDLADCEILELDEEGVPSVAVPKF